MVVDLLSPATIKNVSSSLRLILVMASTHPRICALFQMPILNISFFLPPLSAPPPPAPVLPHLQSQKGVNLVGTFRYRQRPYPAMGEGLALEVVSVGPPRNCIRMLAEREESMPGLRRMSGESGAMSGGSGVSPIPVPAGVGRTHAPLELDDDMMDDVGMLAKMQRDDHVDVQANAAKAVAGLTMDGESCDIPLDCVETFPRRRQFCRTCLPAPSSLLSSQRRISQFPSTL